MGPKSRGNWRSGACFKNCRNRKPNDLSVKCSRSDCHGFSKYKELDDGKNVGRQRSVKAGERKEGAEEVQAFGIGCTSTEVQVDGLG